MTGLDPETLRSDDYPVWQKWHNHPHQPTRSGSHPAARFPPPPRAREPSGKLLHYWTV